MPRQAHVVLATAVALAALAVSGCGPSGESNGIVASFYPLAYAAKEIAGPGVDVTNLTPAGAEPHDLELTPNDVEAVARARLVLYFGDGFMPALESALKDRPSTSFDLLPTGRGRAPAALAHDPHVWLDPIRYAWMVRAIGDRLDRRDAARRLEVRLHALDAAYRAGLAHCDRHEIVTSHAAFGWLAARYGLTQVPLEGLQPEAEPSAKDIARLTGAVRASGATTVFAETLLSPKLAETVARETGATTATLDPLEGLNKDAEKAGEDYFTVMRANLAALQKALGCRS